MALTQVNAPIRREREESTMDKILKAVQIAGGITGVATDVTELFKGEKVDELKQLQIDELKRGRKPLTPEEQDAYRTEGVPDVAIPRTVADVPSALKYIKTKAEKDEILRKENKETRDIEVHERSVRGETRTIEGIKRTLEKEKVASEKERATRTVEPLGQEAKGEKTARDAEASLASLATGDRIIASLIKQREHGGGSLFGVDRELGKQAATQLNFIFKDIEGLGALQQPDLDLLNNLLPQDPLEVLQMQKVTGDTILATLIELRKVFKQKILDRLNAKGFSVTPKMLESAMKSFPVVKDQVKRKFIPDKQPSGYDPSRPFRVVGEVD